MRDANPDKLFAAGDYRAALGAYAKSPLDKAIDESTAKAYRLVDRAACHLRLGEAEQARDLHLEAQNQLNRSTNVFNDYAWALHEQGRNDKACWMADCALETLAFSWGDLYPHVANTLIAALEGQKDTERMLPELAMHQLAAPQFEESQAFFERYQRQIEALWKNKPTPAQLDVLKKHFHRITTNSSDYLASAVAGLLARDPTTWLPELEEMLRRTHFDWQVAVVSAAIQEEASARRVLHLLLDRWVEERLQYKAKPDLRALVLDFFDDQPGLPADFPRALRGAYRLKFREEHWPFDKATSIPLLRKKLTALKNALQNKASKPPPKATTKKTSAKVKAPAKAAKAAKAAKTSAKPPAKSTPKRSKAQGGARR